MTSSIGCKCQGTMADGFRMFSYTEQDFVPELPSASVTNVLSVSLGALPSAL